MYTVKYGGDIHKGDIIGVFNYSCIKVGIYYGRGSTGTIQYINPIHCVYAKKQYTDQVIDNTNKKPFRFLDIPKSIIRSPHPTVMMRMNGANITDMETINYLLQSKEILKEFNIEVNF